MKYLFYIFALFALLNFSSSALAQEKGDVEGGGPKFSYVDMPPIAIPIVGENGMLKQQLSLSIAIEIETLTKEGMDNFKEIERIRPRITDAYIQDLYGAVRMNNNFLIGNVIDIRKVKKRLERVTEEVLGEEHKFHGVLVKELHQIPF